ncbi:MAG: hypothetical protein ABSD48_12210, partial [Armatimonadota bacterium]
MIMCPTARDPPALDTLLGSRGTYPGRAHKIDNLRAAVSQADWYDPELNPKLEQFSRHYGTVILPTKPGT